MRTRVPFAVLVGLAVGASAAAARADTAAADPAADAAPPLQIYAVPALADALRELALAGACPRTALPELVLADGATLAREITRGARADVLATDDAATLDALVAAGRLGSPRRVATGPPPQGVAFWMATLRDARRPSAAADLIERVLSAGGHASLRRAGLRPEPAPPP